MKPKAESDEDLGRDCQEGASVVQSRVTPAAPSPDCPYPSKIKQRRVLRVPTMPQNSRRSSGAAHEKNHSQNHFEHFFSLERECEISMEVWPDTSSLLTCQAKVSLRFHSR
jgi:hypothetical protein